MKGASMLFALAASLFANSPAFAAGHLTAVLSSVTAANSSIVSLTIVNDGDEPVAIFSQSIPARLLEGHLPGSLYKVKQIDASREKEVRYTGIWDHPLAVGDGQFTELKPGTRVSVSYDLSSDYDIVSEKRYHVTYDVSLEGAPFDMSGNAIPTKLHLPTQKRLVSNTLDIAPAFVVSRQR